MKKIFTLLFVATALFACNSDKIETVSIKNQYSVDLPSFLSKATTLHEDASLQYQNAMREFYVVVIDETKQEFHSAVQETDFTADLSGYAQVLRTSLEQSMSDGKFSTVTDTQINGLKAKTFTFEGTMEGLPIYYSVAYIEGKDHYYQIVSWTLQKSKDKYQEQMKAIASSFKETKGDRSAN